MLYTVSVCEYCMNQGPLQVRNTPDEVEQGQPGNVVTRGESILLPSEQTPREETLRGPAGFQTASWEQVIQSEWVLRGARKV